VNIVGNEFWAAIAGALVGGVITFLIQKSDQWEKRRQRLADRSEARRALGYSLVFKMVKIYSNLTHLRSHLQEAFASAATRGIHGEPWQFVLALANSPERVNFSADEMSMLLSLKDDGLFNNLVSMDVIHNSTLDVFLTYRERRSDLLEKLPPHHMEGSIGSAALTGELLQAVRPRMIELNSMIADLRARYQADANQAGHTLQAFSAALNSKLGTSIAVRDKIAQS